MTKDEWIQHLAAKKAASGYTADEVAEYVLQMQRRYAGMTDGDFEQATRNHPARRKGAHR